MKKLFHPKRITRSLKFRYENLEDRHPSAHSLKKYVKKLPNACSLKKYVNKIKGEVEGYFTQIFDLFLEYKKLFMN